MDITQWWPHCYGPLEDLNYNIIISQKEQFLRQPYQEVMCGEKDENPCLWQWILDALYKLLFLASHLETKKLVDELWGM